MQKGIIIATALLGAGGLLVSCSSVPSDSVSRSQPLPDSSEALWFTVASSAFSSGEPIPLEYATVAAGGRNVSVPLEWRLAPPGTKSFAVEVVDLHPMARSWVHWLAIDIPLSSSGLARGASGRTMPSGARELSNGFGDTGWGGPQPPKGSGPHVYRFTVFALDTESLPLSATTSLDQFRNAVQAHSLSSASVTGTFER
jgi:Raf kinase inhibitor-like YbhB/YbcL family protein